MNKKKRSSSLSIYHQESMVGTLIRNPSGEISFSYSEEWIEQGGFAISESLLIQEDIYKGEVVRNFFNNLIPENEIVKESIAAKYRARSTEAFDLLESVGRDCVGSLVFIPEGEEYRSDNSIRYNELSEEEISKRLGNLTSDSPLGMEGGEFRISLAGMQEKTAFLKTSKGWGEPIGTTPTTHIFKPAMSTQYGDFDLSDSVDNEWICLFILRKLEFEVCDADIESFGKHRVLVVKRFDRIYDDPKVRIQRIHQEDICQALGYPSHLKYQSQGGPGPKDIADLLSSSIDSSDKLRFIASLIIFDILGAIDGHAKNFSIFRTKKGIKQTPIYDVLSIYPMANGDKVLTKNIRMAMKFGNSGHYKHSKVRFRHYLEVAKDLRVDPDAMYMIGAIVYRKFTEMSIDESELPKDLNMTTYDSILNGARKRLAIFFDTSEMDDYIRSMSE